MTKLVNFETPKMKNYPTRKNNRNPLKTSVIGVLEPQIDFSQPKH
jgi:hypothetical protein